MNENEYERLRDLTILELIDEIKKARAHSIKLDAALSKIVFLYVNGCDIADAIEQARRFLYEQAETE